MWKAIINYINKSIEYKKPCIHDWELISETNVTSENNNRWTRWIYRCKKCGKSNIINSQ